MLEKQLILFAHNLKGSDSGLILTYLMLRLPSITRKGLEIFAWVNFLVSSVVLVMFQKGDCLNYLGDKLRKSVADASTHPAEVQIVSLTAGAGSFPGGCIAITVMKDTTRATRVVTRTSLNIRAVLENLEDVSFSGASEAPFT